MLTPVEDSNDKKIEQTSIKKKNSEPTKKAGKVIQYDHVGARIRRCANVDNFLWSDGFENAFSNLPIRQQFIDRLFRPTFISKYIYCTMICTVRISCMHLCRWWIRENGAVI